MGCEWKCFALNNEHACMDSTRASDSADLVLTESATSFSSTSSSCRPTTSDRTSIVGGVNCHRNEHKLGGHNYFFKCVFFATTFQLFVC